MAAKSIRYSKIADDPLGLRLCRFERMTEELEMRISSFGKKKRTKSSSRTR